MEKFVVQTVTQIEHTKLDDGTTKHRLIKAWSIILGEPKPKKAKKEVMGVTVDAVEEDFM